MATSKTSDKPLIIKSFAPRWKNTSRAPSHRRAGGFAPADEYGIDEHGIMDAFTGVMAIVSLVFPAEADGRLREHLPPWSGDPVSKRLIC
jgi:hypothetical protein